MVLRAPWGQSAIAIETVGRFEPVDDLAAVARAKRDVREFDLLYRTYLDPVYRYCRHRLGDAHLAEDATQQVFTQALARLPSCRDESFRGWLFTIARNVTANTIRSWRPSSSLDSVLERPAEADSPEDQAINAELAGNLARLLRELSADQREVIELRFSGVSIAETAAILRTSEGAVKQHQRRAVLKLRSLMGLDADATRNRDE